MGPRIKRKVPRRLCPASGGLFPQGLHRITLSPPALPLSPAPLALRGLTVTCLSSYRLGPESLIKGKAGECVYSTGQRRHSVGACGSLAGPGNT